MIAWSPQARTGVWSRAGWRVLLFSIYKWIPRRSYSGYIAQEDQLPIYSFEHCARYFQFYNPLLQAIGTSFQCSPYANQ